MKSDTPSLRLSPEDLFRGLDLRGQIAQDVRMSHDGAFVSWLLPESGDPEAAVLWLMPSSGGPPRSLLTTGELGGPRAELSDVEAKALERRHKGTRDLLEYEWSKTSQTILVSFGESLFLVDAVSGAKNPLPVSEGAKTGARLAPGDRSVSFQRDRNLWIHDVDGAAEVAVGDDASDTVSYGAAEFVAQEEMLRHEGSWWSPDGQRIAYTRVDESAISSIPRIQIGTSSSSLAYDRFPRAGTANAEVLLLVRHLASGVTLAADLGADRDVYVADVAWSRDATVLYVQRQSRNQKQLDLVAVDAVDGTSKVVLSETSDTWVDLERDFYPLGDGSFFWGSARTGSRHLYHYDSEGKLIRPVTHGAWRLAWGGPAAPANHATIVGVDEAGGTVYFLASIRSPLEQHLYSTSYRMADVPCKLTSGSGRWIVTMATARPRCFVGEYSDIDSPPRVGLYSLDGNRLAWLTENRLDSDQPYSRYASHRPSYEFGILAAKSGCDLHYLLAKPADFDPARKYPVVIKVYGGPGVQTVRREWRPLTEQLLTQAGYVVFQLDNRGTANRDEAFEHATHGDLGGVTCDDQTSGVDFLRKLAFVDPTRIGMMGWSFGGYLTVRMMTRPDSGIRAGAAGGVPSDFRLYDTHYTERFLGQPQANERLYENEGLLPRLKDLAGDLLVIQGLSDDNVVLENFTSLVAELQRQGKLFSTSVYPGQGHVPRGATMLTHLWNTYLAFFRNRLSGTNETLQEDASSLG
jgi:dipeptidyl-peptidase-4